MLSQRPPAGGEDQKLIHDFELYYMQLKAVKDDIVKAGDSHTAKKILWTTWYLFSKCMVFFVRIHF